MLLCPFKKPALDPRPLDYEAKTLSLCYNRCLRLLTVVEMSRREKVKAPDLKQTFEIDSKSENPSANFYFGIENKRRVFDSHFEREAPKVENDEDPRLFSRQ